MRIDQETIQRIQQSADIVEVVGDYVSLKKRGANLWACCPFHGEKTPSFSVAPAKGIYKCFGCGKAGDSIRFVMDMEGLGYVEALRHLAKKYGIEIAERELTPEEVQQQNAKESLYIALNHAKSYFQDILFKHDEGQSFGYSYFKERGFNDATIQAFELGYSLDVWDGFTKDALKKGFSLPILEKAGLTIRKNSEDNTAEDRLYDRFRGRVIFPIHNVSGKVIAFGARILKNDKTQPKYINSPETEVYHKSSVLYGIFQAKNAIRHHDTCLLVEGYTDVISLHQAGIHQVVASSGTSLTIEQIRLIGRFTPNITVLYDGDPAGLKASLRGTDMILEEGLNVKVVVFPSPEDPDSYVRKVGPAAFLEFIQKQAKDFITFKAEVLLQEAANDPIKKAETIQDIVGSIAKIPDAIKRMVFFQKTASMMGISEEILIAEANKKILHTQQQKRQDKEREANQQRLAQQKNNNPLAQDIPMDMLPSFSEDDDFSGSLLAVSPQPPAPTRDAFYYQERECVRLLLSYAHHEVDPIQAPGYSLLEYMLAELLEVEFKTPIYAQMMGFFRSNFENKHILDTHFFKHHSDEKIREETFDLLTERYQISENWQQMHDIYVPTETDKLADMAFTNILRVKKVHNEMLLKKLKSDLAQTQDAAQQDQILQIFMAAKQLEKEIAALLGTVVVK
jgi:DNA primase